MLSIPSYKNDDPNYRYKMPRLVAKVEGRGNGIRTNIVNMGDIARALKRPPDYPTKFCGHELGSQSKFDPSEGKAIVNGSHTQHDLQLLIDKFIDKFVLCEQCKLPEIDLLLKKNRVGYRCNACGNQGQVDNRHKLTTFILKNPPDGADSTLGVKNKKNKLDGKKEKSSKTKIKVGEDDMETINVSGEDSKKVRKTKKKKSSSGTKDGTAEHDSGSDDTDAREGPQEAKTRIISKTSYIGKEDKTNQDHSDELHEKHLSKPSGRSKSDPSDIDLGYDSPEVISIIERLSMLLRPETPQASGPMSIPPLPSASITETEPAISPSAFFNELRMLQITQSFDHSVKLFIALKVFFPDNPTLPLSQRLDQYINFLKHVTQGMSCRDILTVFEDLVALHAKTPLDTAFFDFPYVVQKLYDVDILDEDAIIRHYTKTPKRETRAAYFAAKKATEPFINWLRDEESNATDTEAPPPVNPTGTCLSVVSTKQTDGV